MIVLYIDQYYVFIKCPLQKTPVTAFSPYQGTTTGQPCHLLHMPTCYHWLSLDLDPIPGEEHGLKIQGLLAVLGFMSGVAASWKFNWSEKTHPHSITPTPMSFPPKWALIVSSSSLSLNLGTSSPTTPWEYFHQQNRNDSKW